MSTTIKRIALIAVAALGLSVVAVAPSQAAGNANLFVKVADGVTSGSASTSGNEAGGGVAGPYNFVTLSVVQFGAGDVVELTGGNFVTASVGTLNTNKTAVVTNGNADLTVATPTVGTITAKLYKNTGGIVSTTASETVVITVSASAQSGVYSAANSSIILNSGETVTATTDATPTPVATVNNDTAAATIVISVKDLLKKDLTDTITATVVGGSAYLGIIGDSTTVINGTITNAAAAPSVSLPSVSKAYVTVWANGFAGPVTVKLSSGTTDLGQKVITFSSTTVASLTATVVNAYVSSSQPSGAITVVAKDAAGNVINGAVISATSGDTTKVASPASATTASGKASFAVAAASSTAVGAATITFKSGTATTTASVTAAGVKATKLTITPSAATAEAGSLLTYTMTLADANGPIADGDYVGVITSAPVTSNGGTGAFAADTVTVKSGVATSAIYLPFVTGKYTSTWTLKGTAGTATTNLDAALTGTSVVVNVAVTNSGVDAATDAANEATDAANAATDAALAAADAADAATAAAMDASDAVAALSATVAKLVASLKAQITSLTNLVIKIQKKVKA